MLPALSLLLALHSLPAPDPSLGMFRGGTRHEGVYPAARGSYGGIAWRLATGGPVRSSPVVVDGTVYVGSTDGGIYAADAKSGALRWRYAAGTAISATPAVTATSVIVSGSDGSIHAIARTTGKRLWRVATGPDAKLAWGYESGDNWTSSPVVVGTTVLVGSGDGALYALDAASGATRWRAQTGGRIRSSPAVAGDRVVVGSFDGHVYAFDRATGKEQWRFATVGVQLASDTFGYDRKSVQSSPAISGDLVLAGARDGYFYALDLATGKERWRVDHHISWVNCSAAISGGMAYIGSSDGQFAQAVDLATGTERWRADTIGIVWSSPTVAGDVVYVPTTRGALFAFDRTTGRELWRARFGGGSFSSPVIADSRLYLGNEDGGVYALDLTRPAPLRRLVYWDARFDKVNLFGDGPGLRDYLAAHGYTVANLDTVRAALDPARAPGTVIVFALDYLPRELAGDSPATGPLRRFLEAGGRVVWPGVPPLIWPRDTAADRLNLLAINRGAVRSLLGVGHEGANFDQRPVPTITDAGRAWGLSGWWVAAWAADPAGISEVLALDDQGHAAAWVQRYGTAGGRFVRVTVPLLGETALPGYGVVQRLAERL